MPPIGLSVRWLAAGQQHLRRCPVRPELSPDGVTDFSGTYDDYLRSQGVVL